MSQKSHDRRRNFLKAMGGVASLQLIGVTSASSEPEMKFAEIGVTFEFDQLPEDAIKGIPLVPKYHSRGKDGNLHLGPSTELNDIFPNGENEWLVWADKYDSLPTVVMDSKPTNILVDSINTGLQPSTSVKLQRKYRPPKIKVHPDGDSLKIRSKGHSMSVDSGEEASTTLNGKTVPIETHGDANSRPEKMTPEITVRNMGQVKIL